MPTNLFEVRVCNYHQYLTLMAGVVPDWDQSCKQELDDITVQSQRSNSRTVMQVQTCLQSRNAGGMWKTLLIHIRQSNMGKIMLL